MLGNAPILCAGSDKDSCIVYHQESNWSQSQTLSSIRRFAAGVRKGQQYNFLDTGW